MYCSRCGAKNSDNAKFCGACGFPMENEYSAVTENTAPIIINIDSTGTAALKPKLEDGFFFKGIGIIPKILLYALGVFLTFMLAAIVFFSLYPNYLNTVVLYLSRL